MAAIIICGLVRAQIPQSFLCEYYVNGVLVKLQLKGSVIALVVTWLGIQWFLIGNHWSSFVGMLHLNLIGLEEGCLCGTDREFGGYWV